jgi:hypothetical protein
LYRHLLREASYLPPIARPYVDSQIKRRFQEHRRSNDDEFTKRRVRQAHRDLRYLRAANAGDAVRMRRLMLMAFGRLGRRRRELVAELVHRELPANTEELERYADETSAIASAHRELDWLDRWDLDKLCTFARSQVQASLNNPPRSHITYSQTVPERIIPAENSWGRPLTPKLARTKLKKMWKQVAEKCLPPLPKEEWERLGRIANGEEPGSGWLPPPRRPVAHSADGSTEEVVRTWDWCSYATRPVSVVDKPSNRRNKLLSGAVDDNTPTGDPTPINGQRYTPRSWRRLFANVWQLTSTMEKKPDGQRWNITWGKPKFQAPPASAAMDEFFEHLPTGPESTAQGAMGKR